MKYIKHFVNSYGEHTWDFTYYYDEVVPKILKRREDLSPILSSDLNGIDNREKTLNKNKRSLFNLNHLVVIYYAYDEMKAEPPRLYRRVIYLSQAAMPDRVKLS